MIILYDSEHTTYTFPNGVVVRIPAAISKAHNFAAQKGDPCGVVECIGASLGLSACDLQLPF